MSQRESENTIWKADFELKILQRVRFQNKKIQRVIFWILNFTTRQILRKKMFFLKKHDFEEKILF